MSAVLDTVEQTSTKDVRIKKSRVQSIEEFFGLPQPHTPCQDLQHFASWAGDSIWVPPKDSNADLAESMLGLKSLFSTADERWKATLKEHRSKFTQVRKIELPRPSIRLPQGQLYVTVTDQKDFDKIEEEIPKSVQTRLDEFLFDHGHKLGVKVYYLKPLCVEVGSDLVFTTDEEVERAICEIKEDVFQLFRRKYPVHFAKTMSVGCLDAMMAVPRTMLGWMLDRKKREIDMVHAKAEFERRKRTLDAVQLRKKYRTDDRCTFDEVLLMTNSPERVDVINHYVEENSFSELDRQLFLLASSVSLPWFAALSFAAYQFAMVTLTSVPTVAVVDPVFVAEMSRERGKLLKIGHFDEVDGVMHVEI
jgi:hypothetical protein